MKRCPKFYIWGRAAHVGQCYEGLCATTMAAIAEQIMKENGASPVELCDLKPEYNVQTPSDAYAAFEMESEDDDAAYGAMLEKTAAKAVERMLGLLNERREKYCGLCNIKYVPYSYDVKIIRKDEKLSLEQVREWFRLSGIKTPAIIIFQ